jgi:hypothetical protein
LDRTIGNVIAPVYLDEFVMLSLRAEPRAKLLTQAKSSQFKTKNTANTLGTATDFYAQGLAARYLLQDGLLSTEASEFRWHGVCFGFLHRSTGWRKFDGDRNGSNDQYEHGFDQNRAGGSPESWPDGDHDAATCVRQAH